MPRFKDTINNTYELTKLAKMSPKRDAKLHSIQAENNSSGSNKDGEFVDGLKNSTTKFFCHTRWTVRANCLNCSCSETKARIRRIKVYTHKFSYCCDIYLAHLILSHTDNLSQTLQGTQKTAVDAQVVPSACVNTLESIRSEIEFSLFWNKVKQFAEKHKIDELHLPRRKNILNRYMIVKATGDHPENVEEEY